MKDVYDFSNAKRGALAFRDKKLHLRDELVLAFKNKAIARALLVEDAIAMVDAIFSTQPPVQQTCHCSEPCGEYPKCPATQQAEPAPAQDGVVLALARLERIEHRLTDWLELNCCECENGHVCGRNEVTQDRDAIRSALSGHRAQHQGEKP